MVLLLLQPPPPLLLWCCRCPVAAAFRERELLLLKPWLNHTSLRTSSRALSSRKGRSLSLWVRRIGCFSLQETLFVRLLGTTRLKLVQSMTVSFSVSSFEGDNVCSVWLTGVASALWISLSYLNCELHRVSRDQPAYWPHKGKFKLCHTQ